MGNDLQTLVTTLGGGAGGAAGAFVIWAIWTNRLYLPREIKWRDDLIQKQEAAIERWQTTAAKSVTNNERLLNQNEKVIAVAQSLPPPSTEAKQP